MIRIVQKPKPKFDPKTEELIKIRNKVNSDLIEISYKIIKKERKIIKNVVKDVEKEIDGLKAEFDEMLPDK